jgi:Skp family chaperone for outer membrane proteins
MKKLLTVLALVIATGITAAQAQDKSKADGAKRLTDSMAVRLNLSADQVPKVLAINEEFNTKAAGIRGEEGDRVAKLKKIKEANHDREKALKEVLTEDQYKEYLANKKEHKGDARQRLRERKKA